MTWISSPFPDRIVIERQVYLPPGKSTWIYLGIPTIFSPGIIQGETINKKVNLSAVILLEGIGCLSSIRVSQDGGENYTTIFQGSDTTVYGVCIPNPSIPLKYIGYSFYEITLRNPHLFGGNRNLLILLDILEEDAEEYPE